VYFDTSYIAKFYLNESGSSEVRALVTGTDHVYSSFRAFAEFHAVLHRHSREGVLPPEDLRNIATLFSNVWTMVSGIGFR
jgi:predicted nucleic acid-binding protein